MTVWKSLPSGCCLPCCLRLLIALISTFHAVRGRGRVRGRVRVRAGARVRVGLISTFHAVDLPLSDGPTWLGFGKGEG